jgi:hypothetical protein
MHTQTPLKLLVCGKLIFFCVKILGTRKLVTALEVCGASILSIT